MSKTITFQIEFFNYWHSGSGLSGATYADSIVNKTDENLPFIPGKTLKGLLRDAAEKINELSSNLVSQDFILKVFGKDGSEKKTTKEDEGQAFFTNAYLSENLSRKIKRDGLSEKLFTVISSTQIDKEGQAAEGSLRQMEVTIPLTIYAKIENFPEGMEYQLKHCMGWIKQMGQNRNRGLGKCKFSILKQ